MKNNWNEATILIYQNDIKIFNYEKNLLKKQIDKVIWNNKEELDIIGQLIAECDRKIDFAQIRIAEIKRQNELEKLSQQFKDAQNVIKLKDSQLKEIGIIVINLNK